MSVTTFYSATGKVPYQLTNDYLFQAVLQCSNETLKGLVCSLLHIHPEKVHNVVITNPIELGKKLDRKKFILDVRVLLDNQLCLNIELQVVNQGNWPERSIVYLCRSFDQLNKGQDYIEMKPVVQICILDFTLFPDNPEFYATYKLMNIKNHKIYSDKIRVSVLDLTQIKLATEEDRRYRIQKWAKLFKATTWEEIKMLADKDKEIESAAQAVYELTADEKIRLQCEAMEDYYKQERYNQKRLENAFHERDKAIEEMKIYKKEITFKEAELKDKEAEIKDKEAEIKDKSKEIKDLKQSMAEKEIELAQGREDGFRILVTSCQALGVPYDKTLQQVKEQYGLDEKSAAEQVQKYWMVQDDS